MTTSNSNFKITSLTPVGVSQWMEHRSVNQKVAGSIPSQDTGLGCGPGPQLGACQRQLINISLTH